MNAKFITSDDEAHRAAVRRLRKVFSDLLDVVRELPVDSQFKLDIESKAGHMKVSRLEYLKIYPFLFNGSEFDKMKIQRSNRNKEEKENSEDLYSKLEGTAD